MYWSTIANANSTGCSFYEWSGNGIIVLCTLHMYMLCTLRSPMANETDIQILLRPKNSIFITFSLCLSKKTVKNPVSQELEVLRSLIDHVLLVAGHHCRHLTWCMARQSPILSQPAEVQLHLHM